MLRLTLIGSALCASLWFIPAASAQRPNLPAVKTATPTVDEMSSMITPTPEMWLYLHQMQRMDDPKMIVRRKAEARARARENRIAARKWFGMSNSRPMASHTPFMGTYSPVWVSNTGLPSQWSGRGWTGIYAAP